MDSKVLPYAWGTLGVLFGVFCSFAASRPAGVGGAIVCALVLVAAVAAYFVTPFSRAQIMVIPVTALFVSLAGLVTFTYASAWDVLPAVMGLGTAVVLVSAAMAVYQAEVGPVRVRRVPGGPATAATPEQVTLRDAVESAIRHGIEDWNGETNPERFAADAVLHMAELKAVSDVLYRLANGERKMDHGRRQLEIWGVPESFIVWMLRETPKGTSDER